MIDVFQRCVSYSVQVIERFVGVERVKSEALKVVSDAVINEVSLPCCREIHASKASFAVMFSGVHLPSQSFSVGCEVDVSLVCNRRQAVKSEDFRAIGNAELIQDPETLLQLFTPGQPIMMEVKVSTDGFRLFVLCRYLKSQRYSSGHGPYVLSWI